jgi:hypothetical protein
MSSEDGFVTQVVAALSRALTPLVEATSSSEALAELLAQLGWDASPSAEVVSVVARANPSLEELAGDVAAEAPAVTLVADVAAAMAALAELEDVSLGGVGPPFDNPAFWSSLPADLFALLVSEDLARHKPRLYGFLRFLGVLRVEARSAEPGRLAYDARVIDLGALGRAAASPSSLLSDVYGWGTHFDHAQFLPALAALGGGLGGGASRQPPHPDLVAPYMAPDNPDRGSVRLLSLSPFEVGSPTLAALVKPALLVLPLPPEGAPSGHPEGLLVWPLVSGAAAATVDLGPAAELVLDGDLQASPPRVQLRPGGTIVESSEPDLAAALRVDMAPPTPFVMAGVAGGMRLELTRSHFGMGVEGSGAAAEVLIDAALEGSAVLDLATADGFLRSVLGNAQESVSFAVGVDWSSSSGLTFSGSPLPSVTIPTNIRIAGGALSLTEVMLELAAAEANGVELTVSVVGGLELGPFVAVAEHLGVRVSAAPATFDAPGNFGLVDVSFGFKPPDGLGLGLDIAGVVSGGGFLDLDPEIGRYAGVGELDVLGVGLVATGILDTQVPSSQLGWSLFLSLAARFPAVQLGFGFTLNGVGGLVGIERGLDDDALGEAVRSGSLDAILFPENAIADAALILSEIDSIFPSAAGQYVFGPIVKVGWGTPTLVELDAGVAIQLPDPLTVSLLGALSAVLPREDTPILELHVNFAGTINLTEGTLKVDASLTGSQVAGLLVTGDMAVRTAFLDNPTFLVAFGGFHPAFDPPADFPDLDKVGVALDTGDALRVTLGGYFALTSNSVQVGARADLWAGGDGFTIEGGTSFNALITFEPFSFSIGMRVWVSVTAGGFELLGVLLSGRLSGPNPWKVHGVAEFRLLGVKTRFSVDESFGELANEGPPEQADPAQLVRDALGLEDAWSAVPPAGPSPVVFGADGADGALHPSGRVQVLQRLLPLDVEIECYGAAELIGDDIVSVDAVGFAAGDVEDAVDWFASAQYFLLSEDEKLTSPSFTQMKAGLVMGGSGADAPAAAEAVFDHELGYRDPEGRAKAPAGVIVVAARDETMTRALGARTTSTPKLRYSVAEPLWTVANPATARSTGAVPATGTGFYSARTAMAKRPGTPAALVPAYEAELIG